ncbi:TadE/TadG family type IV pilus assembly protein [Bradyrhizobium jicamae]|uniref:TadE/TadG family type IV pilus assembly protein n=1 Tax=Bradyrhizobium jicamae TaxID=280332 RepID=UPI001BA50B11|nr:TadE/TadG family type IV pilus assembly protein [Bradyrhizobium jicamae]MBR0939090.1 pilus assembly protein [Bradyrhizobium jicamae]
MKLSQLFRDERGAALVEFSVVVPLWLSLTFGIMQAGLVLWAQVGLQHGVELAARCASVTDIAIKYGGLTKASPCYTNVSSSPNASANVAAIKSYAAANSFGLNPPTNTFSVNPGTPTCTNGNMVTASYPFTAMTYLFSVTLHAQSCYPTIPSS